MTIAADPDALYAEIAGRLAPALRRLARATERDGERARDLEQDMHLALWRSLAAFDGRCSSATWAYRVAHNVAADHVARARRSAPTVGLEEIEALPDDCDPAAAADASRVRARLQSLIDRLGLPDRSVILLYLEGVDAAGIAAVTGLTPNHVAVKVHRIKQLLASRFQEAA